MTQLIYSPFGALNQLHRELNRAFDGRSRDDASVENEAENWIPHVDIEEDAIQFRVLADLPGVAAGDVDITLDRNVLTIRGSRVDTTNSAAKGYKRRERILGSFARQFALPDSANSEAISARLENGVLELVIPKVEAKTPRKITIQ